MEDHYYILQDRLGEYVEKIESTGWETVKYGYTFTKEKEKARIFSYDDLYNRQDVLPIGIDFQRGFQGNVIRVDKR